MKTGCLELVCSVDERILSVGCLVEIVCDLQLIRSAIILWKCQFQLEIKTQDYNVE